MTNIQVKRFDVRNIKQGDLERADKIIREQDYNYKVNLSVLYQLRSLISDKVRKADDKKKAFYESMKRHDNTVFRRKQDTYPIQTGGRRMEYIETLKLVKSLGGIEFDEYWTEDQA